MIDGLYVLGVTPARAGSVRVPGKNTGIVGGRPLLTYAVEALARSAHVDAVILSTDSPQLAALGADYGAITPALRPDDLASAKARLFDVLAYELERHEARIGRTVDLVVSAQASAPLLRAETVDALIEICAQNGVDAAGTTSEIGHGHPFLARVRNDCGELTEYLDLPPTVARYPSQARPRLEFFNGCAFARRRHMLAPPDPATNALGPRPHGLLMSETESINIDTEFDLAFAEFLLSARDAR